jgi:uncharacterized membrane protein YjjB (DUF3815 family)
VTNHFVGLKFLNQSDISSAVGAFAVGLMSNFYGRFLEGNAFVVMVRFLFSSFSHRGIDKTLPHVQTLTNLTLRHKCTQITGILFQPPSGLGNGGLFNFVVDQTSGSSSSYSSGFNTALQLISTSIGLTVGLGISLVLVHPVRSRRRATGMFGL